MSRFRATLVLLTFAGVTLPLMPVQQLFIWFWPRMARRFPMHYHRLVLRILGVRVRRDGETLQQGPAIFAANHVSWLDIVILSSLAPVSFIARHDINTWPLFGALARLQRTVFVDRARRHTSRASRDEMRERLAAGDMLVLFAEGTSGDGTRVLPFKSTFFSAVENSNVAVQPLSVVYTGHRALPMPRHLRPLYAWYGDMEMPPHLWAAMAQGPIEVNIVCHAPLSTADHGDRKTLAKKAEEAVRRGLVDTLHGRAKMS
ncbi:MAG: 1-acyl-sn-glycerol-3-phosphate acyltransferase [Rhizobiales bacterium]|nr:1-acyl-sn-glycerol-3-phosphate acyltransferase [Hyphomicrobiales bacterium]MBP9172969.1 1-acyl-sn-glycerol-3-phosphate acyltransferase [Hyphomicrobiales bacterium]